jgi:dipeptidyl aminopeptidase/acylaminoacyl peptidase
MIGRSSFVGIALLSTAAYAQTPPAAPAGDNAALFGARPAVMDISLSPDGSRIAYVAPLPGNGTAIVVGAVTDDGRGKAILRNAKTDYLQGCDWVSNARLVCRLFGLATTADYGILPSSRYMAVNADGSNIKSLGTPIGEGNESSRINLSDGQVIDWLPDEEGYVLMARNYTARDRIGPAISSTKQGLGVDRIDTATLRSTSVEPPKSIAWEYISDGRGVVRIEGLTTRLGTGEDSNITGYSYRRPGSREWEELSRYDRATGEGFNPYVVDPARNVVYGFKKTDGRDALYSVALDGSLDTTLILARSDVDIDGLAQIGRRRRAIGATYQTDKRETFYFDPEIKALVGALSRALPRQPTVQIADSSLDERKLLIFAGSDTDPGVYYLFNRDTKELHILMAARPGLVGQTLAAMKPIRFKATDGTMVPGYLTLPPGKESAKGLPAIVMPHGGPGDRDEWGFDWLPQYYAAQGYAVLQPEFRGSTGYGDDWYKKNGYRSWRTAIGDVADAGRWLVSEHIADPTKLAIIGWSYGGYAALQSAVVAPDLYKAVVAIAPVTDLTMLKSQYEHWTNEQAMRATIGSGTDITRDGSPAQNAAKIKVPVLLVHGTMDRNVFYQQSTLMQSRLQSAGGKVQLITFEGLDHQLDDSDARAKMLRESDAFIRAAIGQ